MPYRFPALNLKAKLIFLMVGLLALTLGAEVIVSLGTQEAIVESTQEKVSDLTRAIQISVQELTTIPKWARRVHRVLKNLHPALVDYKGLTRYRDAVVEWLAPFDDGSPTTPGNGPE